MRHASLRQIPFGSVSRGLGSIPSAPSSGPPVGFPVITSQPQSGEAHYASFDLNISVGSDDDGSYLYQWKRNGVNIGGQGGAGDGYNVFPTPDYVFADPDNAPSYHEAGTYTCVVTNAHGSTISDPGIWTVADPVINGQPQSSGDGSDLTVDAAGSSPLSYQWYYGDDSPVSGQTNATFSSPPEGTYYCIVTGPGGSATSDSASILPPQESSPELHWKMNEASGARIDSAASISLNDFGSVGSGAGKIGNCAIFNGTNWLETSGADPVNIKNTSTVCFWMKRTSGVNLFIKNITIYNYFNAPALACQIPTNNGTFGFDTTFSYASNTWVFISCRIDTVAGTVKMGLNGTYQSKAFTAGSTMVSDSNGIVVGGQPGGGGDLSGSIDDLRVYNRLLSDVELAIIYAAGIGTEAELP